MNHQPALDRLQGDEALKRVPYPVQMLECCRVICYELNRVELVNKLDCLWESGIFANLFHYLCTLCDSDLQFIEFSLVCTFTWLGCIGNHSIDSHIATIVGVLHLIYESYP